MGAGFAKLIVGPDGLPLVEAWSPWEPTNELRLVQSSRDDTAPPILQQTYRRRGINSVGHVCAGEFEWRNVPIVFED